MVSVFLGIVLILLPAFAISYVIMLFLFANELDRCGITSETPGIHYYGPGIHRESTDARAAIISA
jgi:hypothetical protein